MATFSDFYPSSDTVSPLALATASAYADRVHAHIHDLWTRSGIGMYGGGRLQLIDPALYGPVLTHWLGREDPTRVPFALSAFGDLFYYRDRGVHDIGGEMMKVEDVCRLDVHYRKTEVCTWEVPQFFNRYLVDEDILSGVLREELFAEANSQLGALEPGEIYTFVPALALGGAEEAGDLQRVEAIVHLEFLFQLTA